MLRSVLLYITKFILWDASVKLICQLAPSGPVYKEGSELLFTHLSLRAGRKSTIITTNLSFERWGEIFQDPVMTAAMIDRLTHQSYIVNMNGNSYRMKETKEWLSKQQLG
jgi:hypothetical protein